MIGLVGKSGAGKSTFANLICRFYEANHGDILIDGHNVRAIQLESLRSQIGMVLQDQFLFNGTIADEHQLCQAGGESCRANRGGPRRERPRIHRGQARWLRHAGG